MKSLLLSLLVFVLCTSISVSQDTQPKKVKEKTKLSSGKEQMNSSKPKEKNKGIYHGKLKFKPGTKKLNEQGELNTLKSVILVIREKSTKKIIAKTTTDSSGKFKFSTITIRKGLELGWAFPQPAGAALDEYGCFEKLPPAPAPPLVLMDECDDSVLIVVKTD